MRRCLGLFLLAVLLHAGEAVDSLDAVRAEFAKRVASIAQDQTDRRVELASWATGKGLAEEANAVLEEVLVIAPDHGRARRALGYERVGKQWLRGDELYQAKKWVRYLGRWMPPNERRKLVARREAMRLQLKQRAGWDKAWEAKTAHFTIKSNCPVRVVEDILVAMEQYYTVAARLFQLGRTSARIPVEVYANRAGFTAASREDRFNVADNVLGYYVPRRDLIRTFYIGSLDDTLGVLFHETTHLIINRFAKRDVPVWTNEGLAVYFEDAERLEDRVDPDAIPWTRLWHLRRMLESGTVDLTDTVQRPHQGYTVEYYPRGWSLVHYLMHGDAQRHRKNLISYMLLLKKGGNDDNLQLFSKAFGQAPSAHQDDWKRHIDSIEPRTAREFARAARASLGSFLHPTQALTYGERAVELGPDDWRSHAALGQARLAAARLSGHAGRAAGAVEAYDQAVELAKADPASILARVKRGQSRSLWTGLLADRMFAQHAAGALDSAAQSAIALLEVDEANAYAYGMLAVLGATEDAAEANEFLATARDIGDDHLVRWCAAQVAAAQGQLDQARTLLAEAATLDRLGVGRSWYPKEAERLTKR